METPDGRANGTDSAVATAPPQRSVSSLMHTSNAANASSARAMSAPNTSAEKHFLSAIMTLSFLKGRLFLSLIMTN
jgi:hypothetical protein